MRKELGATNPGRQRALRRVDGASFLVRWLCCLGSVVDDLVDGVVTFASQPHESSHRRWSMPAAIGCVPWMSHERMTAALTTLGGCCIVVTKPANDLRAAQALLANGHALPTAYLPSFDEVGLVRPDGQRPSIGPGGMAGESLDELGPVRRAGWRGDRSAPLVHAKLLSSATPGVTTTTRTVSGACSSGSGRAGPGLARPTGLTAPPSTSNSDCGSTSHNWWSTPSSSCSTC